jgi:hypothetical protein
MGRRTLVFAAVLLFGSSLTAMAANPSAGSLGPTKGASLQWIGTAPGGVNPGPQLGDHDTFCVNGTNCDVYVLTLSGTPADWEGMAARLVFRWNSPTNDYDIYIHKDTLDGPIVGDSATGPSNIEQEDLDPTDDGTGVFYIHVVYFAATAADQYGATVTVVSEGVALPPAPIDSGPAPRYQSHTPTAEQIAAGMTKNSQDEPNIGVNWHTGTVMLQALMQTLKVEFDDTSCPQTPTASWEDVTPLTSQESFDPILFTDHETDRTIVSHLLLLPAAGASSVTDDDGTTWVPSQGAGFGSGFDHQTVGGGPFHAPLPPPPTYRNAVYYCAQDVAFANCALSVDGGLSYGPAVPMYNLLQCAGLHGHVKVGPDGTVYVPNASCTGPVNPNENGIALSEDNGITWTVRTVPGTAGGGSDPSVAVDDAGRIYLGYVEGDRTPAVAVSDDKGLNWTYVYDVGAMVGVKNAVFPAMVAGGPGRAAVAFYGTADDGSVNDFDSTGVWYLYVAHTYDGGASWITVNATPNDPLQRGGIHLGGGSFIHRNLLDFFDADLDSRGRMTVGYADGCLGACVQAPADARGNSYTAYGTIARQTGGRRLFAEFDQTASTVPGAPRLTVTRNGGVSTLTWSPSENGGAPITKFKVYRGTQQLASLNGSTLSYVDDSVDPGTTYTYRVSAQNSRGVSCGSNAVTAEPAGNSCTAPGIRVLEDASGDQIGAPLETDMDIQWVGISEPFFDDGSRNLVFTLKVASLAAPLTPNRMWRLIWRYPDAPLAPHPSSTAFVGRYYVGMNTDQAGAVSFEYGTVQSLSAVVADASPAERLGDADEGSAFNPDGTITIVIAADKVGGPGAGDLIGGLIARSYPVAQDGTLRGDTASDVASLGETYGLSGNASCVPAVTCLEDNPKPITYSSGWHRVNDADASDDHFRLHKRAGGGGWLKLTFEVPAGKIGAITYHFATSTAGGTADVYLDGASRGPVSFLGGSGSLHDPVFGVQIRFGDLSAGTHTFELRNVSGVAYVDRFCVERAYPTGMPQTGPGETTSVLQAIAPLGVLLQSVDVLAGAQSISAVASGSGLLRLVLLDPAGSVLATADSVGGVAVLEASVSATGLYQVQVLNLGTSSTQAWMAATPFGSW